MTTAPAPASDRLDVGDGMDYDRGAALFSARLFTMAVSALCEGDDGGYPLIEKFGDFLGGEQWLDIAEELIGEALELGPINTATA